MNNEINQKLDNLKNETVALKKEVREKTLGYIMGAFSLIAGLSWNEAIKGLIDHIYPATASGVWAKFVYALIITVGLTIFTVFLAKFLSKNDKE
ncbi:MAG TPA: DUF5654 family protein [Candidatus Magasanikbacteria bacterium]|nr:DUF5654 family protein [Candidatus Magasanikbacteria bacterium]